MISKEKLRLMQKRVEQEKARRKAREVRYFWMDHSIPEEPELDLNEPEPKAA